MVVDAESKKEERRRRRRIRDGVAKARDLAVDQAASQRKDGKVEWRLRGDDKRRAMERLVNWGLRVISEEGSLVHVQPDTTDYVDHQRTPTASYRSISPTAYTPLPPPLMLPLLLRHLRAEKEKRSRVFYRKDDSKSLNGMTLEELLVAMRQWGEEGRWERLGEWRVEEGIQWGLIKGLIMSKGVGFWAIESRCDT